MNTSTHDTTSIFRTANAIAINAVGDKLICAVHHSGRMGVSGVKSVLVGVVTKVNAKTVRARFGDKEVLLTLDGLVPRGVHKWSEYFYPYTEELCELLNQRCDERAAKVARRDQIEAARRRRQDIRHSEQIAVVRRHFNPMSLQRSTLPDGSRVYSGLMPCVANRHEFKYIVVRCSDVVEVDWRSENGASKSRVQCGYTYVTPDSGSFSSCSTTVHDTDDEAILESVRREFYC